MDQGQIIPASAQAGPEYALPFEVQPAGQLPFRPRALEPPLDQHPPLLVTAGLLSYHDTKNTLEIVQDLLESDDTSMNVWIELALRPCMPAIGRSESFPKPL